MECHAEVLHQNTVCSKRLVLEMSGFTRESPFPSLSGLVSIGEQEEAKCE